MFFRSRKPSGMADLPPSSAPAPSFAVAQDSAVKAPCANSDASLPVMPMTKPASPSLPERPNGAQNRRPQLNRASAFGEIVSLLMRSPTYQSLSLHDLRWLVLPPLKCGHVALAETRIEANDAIVPVGAILWAAVSPDVVARVGRSRTDYPRLDPAEWTSGDIVLITTAVGHPRALKPILNKLHDSEWLGRRVLHWVKRSDGTIAITDLDIDALDHSAPAPAPTSSAMHPAA
jgi:hemolysin-activating ACP:hemolysin acyltransferase